MYKNILTYTTRYWFILSTTIKHKIIFYMGRCQQTHNNRIMGLCKNFPVKQSLILSKNKGYITVDYPVVSRALFLREKRLNRTIKRTTK